MILFFSHRARMARRLANFHAGELSPAEFEAVSEHLRSCAECRAELHVLEATAALLRDTAPRVSGLTPEASRALFDRALAASGVLQRRPSPRWQFYAWATPAVLLLLGSGLALQETHRAVPEVPDRGQLAGRPHARYQGDPEAPPAHTAPTAREAPVERHSGATARPRAIQPDRAPQPGRVRTAPRRPGPVALAVVPLEPSEPLEWEPEAPLTAGVERVVLADDFETETPEAPAALDERSGRWPVGMPTVPEVDVQLVTVESPPAGTAHAAAWWMEPTGEWFLKLARVPRGDEQIELLLVSLSRDRVWGYWKEEME